MEKKHIKFGIFYYNPEDPNAVVDRPRNSGWTLNFAHPQAWMVLGALLSFPVIAITFVVLYAH